MCEHRAANATEPVIIGFGQNQYHVSKWTVLEDMHAQTQQDQ